MSPIGTRTTSTGQLPHQPGPQQPGPWLPWRTIPAGAVGAELHGGRTPSLPWGNHVHYSRSWLPCSCCLLC